MNSRLIYLSIKRIPLRPTRRKNGIAPRMITRRALCLYRSLAILGYRVPYLCVVLLWCLFLYLLSNVIVCLRLLEVIFLRPYILIRLTISRLRNRAFLGLRKKFPLFLAVRPYLYPPSRTDPIKVSTRCPQGIRTLSVRIRINGEISSTIVHRNLLLRFFFGASSVIRECA